MIFNRFRCYRSEWFEKYVRFFSMATDLLSSSDKAKPVVNDWNVLLNSLMMRRRKSRKYMDSQSADSTLSLFSTDIMIVEYSPVRSLAF